uniref:Uncharacterized protein n=1 Tax=Anguilla anguilla TaxID=7936 RepID=A0A0E9VZI5_ANGAN
MCRLPPFVLNCSRAFPASGLQHFQW